jgi:asparagine synthase (glutamine-hydrolysing)
MCGIAGYINIDHTLASKMVLKKQTDEIKHRGPDGEGYWVEGNVAIGHRRLSIIDLTDAGKQPMVLNERFVISYNGEIYNYKELKSELEELGYVFSSKTDTEVVLNSFIQWGNNSVSRFNGMFSFVIWDRKEKLLFLARDRYGIKPLYYSIQDNCFYFGSEQKAITVHPKFVGKLNKAGLLEYFTFQNLFTDNTLTENINMLPAGNYAVFSPKEKKIIKTIYWDYYFRDVPSKLDDGDYIEELSRLFSQAVKRQLLGDVEIGAYLSGGMDSGSITAIASKYTTNLKTFTCGFDLSSASGIELGFDERVKAEAMSALFKTEHYEMVLKAGDMERCLPKLAWHLEEPRVGQSYPNYYAAKLASKFVKVVLSGSGGDELFGGYPWRYYRASNSMSFEGYIDSYYEYWQRLVTQTELKLLFKPIWSDVKDVSTRDIFSDVFINHSNEFKRKEDYINHSLYFEAKTFLHGLFVVEDKLSMAHGLENRVPFMDNDLVEFAMQCPVSLKLNSLDKFAKINENEVGGKKEIYFQKTNDGKQILRRMMSKYIPVEVTLAKKQGFSSPDASWFKGESIDFVKRKLLNNNALIYEFLDKKIIENLLFEHFNGVQNRRLLIWSLLNIEEALNNF